MSEIAYIRKNDKWREFCSVYLYKNGYCVSCEAKGKLTYSTMVYQPTPEEDKRKTRYRDYNLMAMCHECYFRIQVKRVLKELLHKTILLILTLVAVAILITIIF